MLFSQTNDDAQSKSSLNNWTKSLFLCWLFFVCVCVSKCVFVTCEQVRGKKDIEPRSLQITCGVAGLEMTLFQNPFSITCD